MVENVLAKLIEGAVFDVVFNTEPFKEFSKVGLIPAAEVGGIASTSHLESAKRKVTGKAS